MIKIEAQVMIKIEFYEFYLFNHSPIVPNVTFLKRLFISKSVFKQFLNIKGVILCFLSFFASFPAIYKSYADKYSKMAAIYTALPLPTLKPANVPFICLLILPTGNTSPAFDDLDRLLTINAFAFFA